MIFHIFEKLSLQNKKRKKMSVQIQERFIYFFDCFYTLSVIISHYLASYHTSHFL